MKKYIVVMENNTTPRNIFVKYTRFKTLANFYKWLYEPKYDEITIREWIES